MAIHIRPARIYCRAWQYGYNATRRAHAAVAMAVIRYLKGLSCSKPIETSIMVTATGA